MNDKPPSTSGTGAPGLFARIRRAIKGEPWSRDEIQTFIQTDVELDAEEKSMLAGVLEVSETQAREVMVPRSQMVVIDIDSTILGGRGRFTYVPPGLDPLRDGVYIKFLF